MNDQNTGFIETAVMAEARNGRGQQIKEQNPQNQLGAGKRNETKDQKEKGLKIPLLGIIQSVVHLGHCTPEREDKEKE